MSDVDSVDFTDNKSVESTELDDEKPFFQNIWKNVEESAGKEEYIPSDEIVKHYLNSREMLYDTLFSIKYFRSNTVNNDSQFIKLSKYFNKLRIKIMSKNEKNAINLFTLAKNHLKPKTKEDDDLQIDDQGTGTFLAKCPISQMPFEIPVTQRFSNNKEACIHTFEKTALNQLMGKNYSIDCPIAACQKKVFRNMLLPDYEYIQHIRYKEIIDSVQKAKEYFKTLHQKGDDFDFPDEDADSPIANEAVSNLY